MDSALCIWEGILRQDKGSMGQRKGELDFQAEGLPVRKQRDERVGQAGGRGPSGSTDRVGRAWDTGPTGGHITEAPVC